MGKAFSKLIIYQLKIEDNQKHTYKVCKKCEIQRPEQKVTILLAHHFWL